MTRHCYTCGIEEGTEPLAIYSCGGPQDMLLVSVKYWGDEEYICETCQAALTDIVFYMRHDQSLTSVTNAWKRNKIERMKYE